jgi:hypothetical protein
MDEIVGAIISIAIFAPLVGLVAVFVIALGIRMWKDITND